MGKMLNTTSTTNWTREELETLSDLQLHSLLAQLLARLEQIDRAETQDRILKSIRKQRSSNILVGSLSTVRLSSRLEKLFDAVRSGITDPWPIDEVLDVFDGLISRMIAKRLTIALVGLITVVPAVASLVLLAQQNHEMIEESRVQEMFEVKQIRKSLLEAINSTSLQATYKNGQQSLQKLPNYHKRIREEAFGSFIAIDKQRWPKEAKKSIPPTRWVDLRGCNLQGLAIGGALGLIEGENSDDLTCVFLAESNLTDTKFLQSKLTGSVFRDTQAEGIKISSPDARYCDFSNMRAPNSTFFFEATTSTPLDLSHASFSGADLSNAVFDQVMLIEVDFDGTDLSGVQIVDSMVVNCDFTRSDLRSGLIFRNTPIHKTLIRKDQQTLVKTPSYCFYEPTENPNQLRIMTDPEKYNAWWEMESQKMDEAAETELREIEAKNTELSEAG